MKDFFAGFEGVLGFGRANLQTIFDAEIGTPDLIDAIASETPHIREVMGSLRGSLPLMPNSGVGPFGRFYRLPNHYRSVSFMMPPMGRAGANSNPGVIVFKGTEPLLPDLPAYYDWMLSAPFRGSPLPLGLHFPLDMKLPPAAMWIEECIAEQSISSKVQGQYLGRYGSLARLPVPLFVFKMTPPQTARYESIIRSRISEDAIRKIKNKLAEGLGVEVYYYPELPVRVADLFVGSVRETFKDALSPAQVEVTFGAWTRLLSELLCIGYMPYAPWHHGMGGCVDQGNVCIDGGFNDLLTLVSFDAIPDDVLFRNSLQLSIRMLAESMTSMVAASTGVPVVKESEAGALAMTYVTEGLRDHVRANVMAGHHVDSRLQRFFDPPQVSQMIQMMVAAHGSRGKPTQYVVGAQPGPHPAQLVPEFVMASGT